MAYVSQETKKSLAPKIKSILQKYGIKGTLSVNHYSTLVLTIKSGTIDFIKNYNDIMQATRGHDFYLNHGAKDNMSINKYWYHQNFDGVAKEFLSEIIEAMNVGNYDNSDPQIDYFNVGWYIDIKIGSWNKPYIVQS